MQAQQLTAAIEHLSLLYAPARVDLSHAARQDWSRTKGTALKTTHWVPSDVTKEHLDYDLDVFSFMNRKGILFDLVPVVRGYARDRSL